MLPLLQLASGEEMTKTKGTWELCMNFSSQDYARQLNKYQGVRSHHLTRQSWGPTSLKRSPELSLRRVSPFGSFSLGLTMAAMRLQNHAASHNQIERQWCLSLGWRCISCIVLQCGYFFTERMRDERKIASARRKHYWLPIKDRQAYQRLNLFSLLL